MYGSLICDKQKNQPCGDKNILKTQNRCTTYSTDNSQNPKPLHAAKTSLYGGRPSRGCRTSSDHHAGNDSLRRTSALPELGHLEIVLIHNPKKPLQFTTRTYDIPRVKRLGNGSKSNKNPKKRCYHRRRRRKQATSKKTNVKKEKLNRNNHNNSNKQIGRYTEHCTRINTDHVVITQLCTIRPTTQTFLRNTR